MQHEPILGGQRSGKSRRAESRAGQWLARPGHSAVLLATALAGDDEMRARIERHRADRALREHGVPQRLVGLGLTPLTREARRFVHELGRLHQAVAAACAEVTLMVAGVEVPVKRSRG